VQKKKSAEFLHAACGALIIAKIMMFTMPGHALIMAAALVYAIPLLIIMRS